MPVRTLLGHMANSRLLKLGLARCSPGSQQATITERAEISSQSGSPQGQQLLERVQMVGDGDELAGRRIKWDRLEEERGRWVRQANWMARVTGQSLVRKGQFLTA